MNFGEYLKEQKWKIYDINTNWLTVRQIDSGMAVYKTFSYGELKMLKEKTVQPDCRYKQKNTL